MLEICPPLTYTRTYTDNISYLSSSDFARTSGVPDVISAQGTVKYIKIVCIQIPDDAIAKCTAHAFFFISANIAVTT